MKIESIDAQARKDALIEAVLLLRARTLSKAAPYSCHLPQESLDLVPSHSSRRGRRSACGNMVFVSAGFRYQAGSAVPDDVAHSGLPLEGFLSERPIVWLQDQGTSIWAPFWVPKEWDRILRSFRPCSPSPPNLPARMLRSLVTAGILVERDEDHRRSAAWVRIRRQALRTFREKKYAIIRNLVHPLQLRAMRRYYRALVAAGKVPKGDSQVAERYRLHSEFVARFLHPQLSPLLSELTEESIKPSYVYFASYHESAALPRHLDREQCEFSISIQIDYSPEPNGATGWPLFLENTLPRAVDAVNLGLGDGVIYKGRELAHYRHALPAGHTSTSLFLHYVRKQFIDKVW